MNSSKSITINADIERVWEILTLIEQWPQWQKSVSKASAQPNLEAGTKFSWTSGGLSIKSTIIDIGAPGRITWTGKAIGTTARHSWLLTQKGGATIVETSESMVGWLATLIGFFDKKFLDKALSRVLNDLKVAAERRQEI